MSKILNAFLGMMLSAVTCHAQSIIAGLEPGVSARDDVRKAFGEPMRQLSETLFEYNPQAGTGKIEVEYRTGSPIVERIEVHFLSPIGREALIKKLSLPPQADEKKRNAEGNLVEYFDGSALSLIHEKGGEASRVASLGYHSRQSFDKALGRQQPARPISESANSAAPTEITRKVTDQPVQGGKARRGRIGVNLYNQPLTRAMAEQFGYDSTNGALVTKVATGSPAEKAGIRRDDIITVLNPAPSHLFLRLLPSR